MFFAKGEIIMNNIYKVIWSKAKNCYVVASEIARSHTKSASGSGKIGGVTRRSLLASLMALSLLCGGLGVASAADVVHVDESATGTHEVYTKTGVDTLLADYGRKTEVETNKNNIVNLQTTTTDQGQKIATNTADIANNKTAIDKKIDTVTADARYAAKADLIAKADVTALDGKADKSYVDTAVANAVTTAGTNVDNKLTDYYNKAAVDGKIADEATARDTAINTAITLEKDARRTAIETAINGEVGARNQAIHTAITQEVTARDAAVTNAKTELQGKITEEETARKAADVELTGKITAEETARTNADNALDNRLTTAEGKIGANETAIGDLKAKDTVLEGKITTLDGKVTTDIADLKAKDTELEGRIHTNEGYIETNKNAIAAIDKRTAGIGRIDATSETTIENNVKVDSIGNVTAEGKLTGKGVDAGTGDITTTGAVNAGSLNVTDASHLKGDVTMDKTLSVTGDTSLGALNVTGESSLKNTQVNGTLTTTGKATFKEAVDMDKGLTVTSGDTTLQNTDVKGALNVTGESNLKNTKVDGTLGVTGATTLSGELTAEKNATFKEDVTVKGTTNLKGTTVDGDLKVTGTITTDKMVFGDPATNNYTEIDHGKVTSKNLKVNGAGQAISSSSTFDVEKNEVGFGNGITGDHSYHKQTAKGINGSVTDKDGNKTYTKVTATENSFQVQDKDGKNKNHQVNTKDSSVTEIKNGDGKTTKTEQTATDITNTAKDGTIKNEANHIENTATTMKTTVTGQATEDFKGGLNTTVTGTENHTVNGKQINTVTEGQENIISGGQTNTITGGQINNITGDQTTTVTGGNISNKAEKITNEANTELTDKVGTNTRVIDSTSITDTVGTTTNRKIEDGKITDTAGDSTVTTKDGEGTTFAKTTSAAYSTGTGARMNTNIAGNHITTGRVDANELGVSDKDGDNTSDFSVEAGVGKGVKASAGDGTTTGSLDVTAKEVGSSVKDDASGKGSTFKQRIDVIMGKVKTDAGESEVTQTGDEITSKVGLGEATNSRVTQKKDLLEAAVTDGTNYNISNDTANASAKVLTDGTKVNQLQDNLYSSEKMITNGTYTTSKLQTALDITNTASDGTITNDAKNIVNNATSDMTNTVGGNQTNTIGGNQTTTVTGDISNKAKNITNEASDSITDKVGDHTRVLDGDGITDTVGGSTFKQRIDKIMMESKDVSIKAEETLTNEAKVITNKASEVINNEAVNINNTATGIITSKASEIKNQADKLISNKVGENTWENMENGKITTSIKDGAKQNLTQSNAAGTTQSTVDVGKSTVTIQNADGLVDVVTDGTNTSVQNQTASQIAAAVKDEAGNENASVANATTSANTIKSGSKANTVTSTADGTTFNNSKANTAFEGGTYTDTTIKGNTITTGKVTMDYADVMKDLGVRGNANITGKTTTGSLEVTGTSTLKGEVTMESNATVKKDLKVEGTTTTKTLKVTENAEIDGNATIKGDVTARSYKVGDKTYIDAAGINANDQKITNVADGSISEGSKDAVNGGQLYDVKRDLEHQVDKVGANAAAMANLRPMEFDPSSKWNIAAAIGNYGSETAAALGAFYRPNDDVMVNLSTAFGTGENMVGGGVSVRLGKGGNKLSREENNALKDQVADLTARMDALLSVLNPNMSKDFPDVPENHWAYEAVSRLAGNDIVQGYPDGEFHGERTMTRYEMAEIIYNALSRGAEAEKELVEEFKPELQAMAASEKATAEKAEG